MEEDRVEGLLIDYIDDHLDAAQRREVEQMLAESERARQLLSQLTIVMGALDKSPALEPAPSLKENFAELLKKEIASERKLNEPASGRLIIFQPMIYRSAAAVLLLMAGIGIGYWVNKTQHDREELAALHREMDSTRHLMMAMLENQQSASQRVLGATAAYHLDKADDPIIHALVKTMNNDPNTNVRMAALEALAKFSHQETVRRSLIASLATQKDPIVQIALIQLMVKMKEKGAIKDLEKISRDIETMKAVKDEAYSGILELS